jgi:hypothetical protein
VIAAAASPATISIFSFRERPPHPPLHARVELARRLGTDEGEDEFARIDARRSSVAPQGSRDGEGEADAGRSSPDNGDVPRSLRGQRMVPQPVPFFEKVSDRLDGKGVLLRPLHARQIGLDADVD